MGELPIPKEILKEYNTGKHLINSIDSDIVHLQNDVNEYLKIQSNIIFKLITKINELESKKETKKP